MFTLKRQHKTLNEVLANNDSEAVDIVKDLFRSIDKMNKAQMWIERLYAEQIYLFGEANKQQISEFVWRKMGIS